MWTGGLLNFRRRPLIPEELDISRYDHYQNIVDLHEMNSEAIRLLFGFYVTKGPFIFSFFAMLVSIIIVCSGLFGPNIFNELIKSYINLPEIRTYFGEFWT